jgi:ribosomal protein L30/L7E
MVAEGAERQRDEQHMSVRSPVGTKPNRRRALCLVALGLATITACEVYHDQPYGKPVMEGEIILRTVGSSSLQRYVIDFGQRKEMKTIYKKIMMIWDGRDIRDQLFKLFSYNLESIFKGRIRINQVIIIQINQIKES